MYGVCFLLEQVEMTRHCLKGYALPQTSSSEAELANPLPDVAMDAGEEKADATDGNKRELQVRPGNLL